MTSATAVFDAGLRGGQSAAFVRQGGARQQLPVHAWAGEVSAADQSLLAGCVGPTLDIGCGPGRLTTALSGRGIPSMGIDVSPVAIGLTRARGGTALQRDVFEDLPGAGRWSHLLLADGNIGIGGDPIRLLQRCRQLMSAHGSMFVDVEPPGAGLLIEEIRLETGGHLSAPFRWCWVGADQLAGLARSAGLTAQDIWRSGSRWQARLARSW